MFRSQGTSEHLRLVYMQTNQFYMDGSTEIILGKALRQHKRKISGEISVTVIVLMQRCKRE